MPNCTGQLLGVYCRSTIDRVGLGGKLARKAIVGLDFGHLWSSAGLTTFATGLFRRSLATDQECSTKRTGACDTQIAQTRGGFAAPRSVRPVRPCFSSVAIALLAHAHDVADGDEQVENVAVSSSARFAVAAIGFGFAGDRRDVPRATESAILSAIVHAVTCFVIQLDSSRLLRYLRSDIFFSASVLTKVGVTFQLPG